MVAAGDAAAADVEQVDLGQEELGRRVAGVEGDRPLEVGPGRDQRVAVELVLLGEAALREVVDVEAAGRAAQRPRLLALPHLRGEAAGDLADDAVLRRVEVGGARREPVGPDVVAGRGVEQPGVDPERVAVTRDAARQQVADPEPAADLGLRQMLAGQLEGGVAGDDPEVAVAGQLGQDVLGQPGRHRAVGGLRVVEREDRDRGPPLGRLVVRAEGPQGPAREQERHEHRRGIGEPAPRSGAAKVGCGHDPVEGDAEGLDHLGEVLDLVQPGGREGEVDLALDLAVDAPRQPHAAGLAQALDPRRHVDAVAVDRVAVDDHVAEVDADPEADALVFRDIGILLQHGALDRDGGLDRVDGARELDERAVALEVDDPAAVPVQDRPDHLLPQAFQPSEGARLVALHQAAVAGHIGRHDRRQPPLEACFRHSPRPWPRALLRSVEARLAANYPAGEQRRHEDGCQPAAGEPPQGTSRRAQQLVHVQARRRASAQASWASSASGRSA